MTKRLGIIDNINSFGYKGAIRNHPGICPWKNSRIFIGKKTNLGVRTSIIPTNSPKIGGEK